VKRHLIVQNVLGSNAIAGKKIITWTNSRGWLV